MTSVDKSPVPASPSTAKRSAVSLPELTLPPNGALWLGLLVLAVAPVWLTVRAGGDQRATGLFLMHAGCVGVFLVIRRQYLRITKWIPNFPAFLDDAERGAASIGAFVRAPWHLHGSSIAFCLTFSLTACLIFARGGLFRYDRLHDAVLAMLFVAIASVTCALGLCAMFQMARLVGLLADFKPFVSSHRFGVLSAGHMLTGAYIDAALVWCLYTATAAACRDGWFIPAMGLAVPAIIFFGVSFVGAQVPLHRAMLAFKAEQVRTIEARMRSIEPQSGVEITEELQRRLEYYEKRLQNVLALPEWPFRWPALLTVVGSGAATIIAPIATNALTNAISGLQF